MSVFAGALRWAAARSWTQNLSCRLRVNLFDVGDRGSGLYIERKKRATTRVDAVSGGVLVCYLVLMAQRARRGEASRARRAAAATQSQRTRSSPCARRAMSRRCVRACASELLAATAAARGVTGTIVIGVHCQVARMLAADPSIVALRDYEQRTALHIACAAGMVGVVRLLLRAGAKTQVKDRYVCALNIGVRTCASRT